jgi:hypothetical protein
MIYNPKANAMINIKNIFSLMGAAGGVGGALCVGAGGLGTAKARETPKRYIQII